MIKYLKWLENLPFINLLTGDLGELADIKWSSLFFFLLSLSVWVFSKVTYFGYYWLPILIVWLLAQTEMGRDHYNIDHSLSNNFICYHLKASLVHKGLSQPLFLQTLHQNIKEIEIIIYPQTWIYTFSWKSYKKQRKPWKAEAHKKKEDPQDNCSKIQWLAFLLWLLPSPLEKVVLK